MKLKTEKIPAHGGRRLNSGRPTFFRGKSAKSHHPLYKNVPPPTSILLTREGLGLLDGECRRLTKDYRQKTGNKRARISRNVVVEALVRIYGDSLSLRMIERADAD